MIVEVVFLGVRMFVGGILIVAVLAKARDLGSFRSTVRAFRVVPRGWERSLTSGLLVAESAAAAMLVVRPLAVFGLGLAVVLIMAFTAGMVRLLLRGESVACGCFGVSTTPIGMMHVVRNAVISATGVTGVFAGALSEGAPVATQVFGLVSLFAGAGVVLVLILDRLLEVPSSMPARVTPGPPGRRPVNAVSPRLKFPSQK